MELLLPPTLNCVQVADRQRMCGIQILGDVAPSSKYGDVTEWPVRPQSASVSCK